MAIGEVIVGFRPEAAHVVCEREACGDGATANDLHGGYTCCISTWRKGA